MSEGRAAGSSAQGGTEDSTENGTKPDVDLNTALVHAGRPERSPGAGVNPSIDLNSTYLHDTQRPYGRNGNDTVEAVEAVLGLADGGHATLFSSGQAAAAAVLWQLASAGVESSSTAEPAAPSPSIVVMPRTAYHGVRTLAEDLEQHGAIRLRWIEPDQLRDLSVWRQQARGASLLWCESLGNPLMEVLDVPAVVQIASEAGARSVVDATMVTPVRQRPLELGADVVVHSASKFLGGHSDLLAGVVVCADLELAVQVRHHRTIHGAMPGAFEAFLVLRGVRTLAVRMDAAERTAGQLASWLAEQPEVTTVLYPGLVQGAQAHPDAVLAQQVLRGPGAMLAFCVSGDAAQADAFCARLRLIHHATSLGGVESLIERRSRWAGDAAVAPETLLRFSVGLEGAADLQADLRQAWDRASFDIEQ